MVQKIVRVESNGLSGSLQEKVDKKLSEMNKMGFRLISMSTIPSEKKVYDFDGTPYGKNEQREMIFEGEKEYQKPQILAHDWRHGAPGGTPCNPPGPGRR